MNNKILLSICLPTYNQPQDFKRTLLSIISQINEKNQQEIEIVIGDNSTNQETEDLVKKEFNLPYIHYYRHGTNLGVDRNILFLIEKAKGEYIWLFGDDEMKPSAIDYVLNILKQNNNLSLIWVNFEGFDPRNLSRPYIDSSEDLLLKDGNEVLKKIGLGIYFISTLIMKRKNLLGIDHNDIKKFVDSGLIVLYLPLFLLSQKEQKFLIITRSLIISRFTPREKIKWDYFQVCGINFYFVVNHFREKFKKKTIKQLQQKVFSIIWRDIFLGWLKGYNNPKGKLKRLLKIYWRFPQFWFIVPLFFMPKFVIRVLYRVKKALLEKFSVFR